jgi:uncharacterized protein with HEPN domain
VSPNTKLVRNWRMRVEDILESIEKIESYTKNVDSIEFVKDSRTFDAVIRNFEIIGEAAHHVPEDIKLKHPEIPWQILKDFRNKVAHEYFGVDTDIVWRTIQQSLLPLKSKLVKIK